MIRNTLFLALIAFASAAQAQTVAEIDKRDGAVFEAWQKTPLAVRHVTFVDGHPDGFGEYQARADSVFKPGEKLVAYAEPIGYGWKDDGGGFYSFGFHVDFKIWDAAGKLIGEQKNFADLAQKSHARNREFMLVLTLSLSGAPAGDYVLEYTLRDITGDRSTSFKLPFNIAG